LIFDPLIGTFVQATRHAPELMDAAETCEFLPHPRPSKAFQGFHWMLAL
jgi:hypothetical protein